MASPIQDLFHWVAGKKKKVCPQKRILKHLLSGLQQLQDFEGRERSLPNKEVGHSGITRNRGENLCPFQQQRSAWMLFVIVFPVAPKMVQVWEEKALEQEVRPE